MQPVDLPVIKPKNRPNQNYTFKLWMEDELVDLVESVCDEHFADVTTLRRRTIKLMYEGVRALLKEQRQSFESYSKQTQETING